MIRPRAGHFSYTKEEVEIIEQDILFAREVGCRGIVIGALTTDFKLDLSLLKRWKIFAGSMYFTFNRAIDVVIDPFHFVVSSHQQTGKASNIHSKHNPLKHYIVPCFEPIFFHGL